MTRAPSASLLLVLRSVISGCPYICAGCAKGVRRPSRNVTTSAFLSEHDTTPIPLRKQLKDEAKANKLVRDGNSADKGTKSSGIDQTLLDRYELTIGLEIHAELSTNHKLFSSASTSEGYDPPQPNTHVAPFDSAIPGTQPQFQTATLLPAVRAALALGCAINRTSTWDRKHYFWWDQPNGYQITQYYKPLAVKGRVDLTPSDYHALKEPVSIGIKQIQMEQDTAKTVLQPPDTHLLDFNRVSHPLIEIISMPELHSPEAAAAFVRKVQGILKAVGACETGMEMGGLRCDVNVSVKARDAATAVGSMSYAGVSGLGQRTEIKNLSSVAAVAAAITAERNRQIEVLEAGGKIEGETRGWTLGATSTHRLRGKEGEVDYRYMPDADLPPLVIGEDLIDYLQKTLPELPEALTLRLVNDFDLMPKDAATMFELDDGERVDYYFDVIACMHAMPGASEQKQDFRRFASNWVLHELGALLTTSQRQFEADIVTAEQLATILVLLRSDQITLPTAKELLAAAFEGGLGDDVNAYVDAEGLRLKPLTDDAYAMMAEEALMLDSGMAQKAQREAEAVQGAAAESAIEIEGTGKKKKKQKPGGKLMWFVGQMVRSGEDGRVQPERAEQALRRVLLNRATELKS